MDAVRVSCRIVIDKYVGVGEMDTSGGFRVVLCSTKKY
jgi:hypothetical protein